MVVIVQVPRHFMTAVCPFMVSSIPFIICNMTDLNAGDEFNFNIVDLWSNNSPWPFSSMPKSYFFLVKHPWLWRLNFRCSEPAFVHEVMFQVVNLHHLSSRLSFLNEIVFRATPRLWRSDSRELLWIIDLTWL